jgi:outer membrane lipoprotein-sorting protein
MSIHGRVLPALGLALAASLAIASPPSAPADPELENVLRRFDAVQSSIHSLSADFSQTTVNPLLKQPQMATGRFYLRKPDSVLWEYASPEPMTFAIDAGKYTGYFPGRKKAERRDVHRWTEQIFRFFAVGQASSELRKFYDIRMEEPGSGMGGSVLLVLEPTKRRVRKRVEEVRLWVDASTSLPVRVAYANRQGATRTLVFSDVRLNPDLSAALFDVAIPAGVTVTSGFTELGASADEAATPAR